MDPVYLSRLQFGLTAGFHFLFPPLTIGLAWLIFWMMTRYMRTGDDFDRRMARFWTKLFVVSFVVGVATGITLEFQFGTNWSNYSRYVGDIFGAPLAAEGVLSFFLESTFLGVLIFGWNRVSKKTLWFASLMVAVGATLSAFWIIVANSWQQTPAGYVIRNGRAELTDFWAAVFNPSTMHRYTHTVDAAIMTGAMFMLGVSAWFLLKGRHTEFAKSSLKISLIMAFVSSLIQLPIGHHHGGQVARTQPEKLAAMEGIFKTQRHAPSLIFGVLDKKNEVVRAKIAIPGMLSWLAKGDVNAEIQGINAFKPQDRPPLPYTFYTFRGMVMIGFWCIGLTGLGLILLWRKTAHQNRLFLRLALWSIPLPFIANQLGWFSAEVGRQPWAVYRELRTSDAYSPTVPAGQVLFSIIMFTLVYSLLFVLWVHLLRREINHGPEATPAADQPSGPEVSP
ncbi:MAG: cytochrome ubiquinol oxidase subunit I [Phycisphaerae bacterium]|nr:cytochrome ubiquinol oxidase subunit I [Phycisphaerae bacterium]